MKTTIVLLLLGLSVGQQAFAEGESVAKKVGNGIKKGGEAAGHGIEKGIEATEKLAASPNSKIIVIGNGDGDLPIILGGEK